MHRTARVTRSPQQQHTKPTIASPADVYFSGAWQIILAWSGMLIATLVWNRRWLSIATLGFVSGAIWRYARYHEPAHPCIRTRAIADARFPTTLDGFTIAQISDIHLGQPHSDANLAWTIDTLRRLKPDMICLTGDMINDRPALTRLVNYLRQLDAPCGIFAIAGNHDYVEEINDVRTALAVAGIPLLENQGMIIQHREAAFWLAGVDDVWHGSMDIGAAVNAAPAGMPIILLAHSPDAVLEAIHYPAIVLQLSGHVHGGHIRLPGLGPLAKPRYGRHYTHDTQLVGSVHLHISLGLSGRPFRIGNTPELTIIQCMHHEKRISL